jgi:hypothetical protein
MRAAVAALLAAVLVVMAGAPHVHTGPEGDHDCPACLTRTIDAARTETPDVAPVRIQFPAVVVAAVVTLPVGYPLGAISGQSPPLSA